jgi:hypothetical protein
MGFKFDTDTETIEAELYSSQEYQLFGEFDWIQMAVVSLPVRWFFHRTVTFNECIQAGTENPYSC